MNEIQSTSCELQINLEISPVCSRSAGIILKTPFGTPASWEICLNDFFKFYFYIHTSARARAESGVSSAGFTTTVQPEANAAPTFRAIIALGKFHLQMKITLSGKFIQNIQVLSQPLPR